MSLEEDRAAIAAALNHLDEVRGVAASLLDQVVQAVGAIHAAMANVIENDVIGPADSVAHGGQEVAGQFERAIGDVGGEAGEIVPLVKTAVDHTGHAVGAATAHLDALKHEANVAGNAINEEVNKAVVAFNAAHEKAENVLHSLNA
jgi:hypothetical protein